MCNCIEVANKALAQYNTELAVRDEFTVNRIVPTLVVPTRKIDPKIRGKPRILVVNYCPLCGESQIRTPLNADTRRLGKH